MNTARPTLAARQQQLVRALMAHPGSDEAVVSAAALLALGVAHPQSERGLQAYRANGHALAERTLQAAYPVVGQLVGEATLHAMARALWHAHPPTRGDLAHWGQALPAWIAQNPALAALPYLADVARAEWALHEAASAPDQPTDLASITRLVTEDPARLALRLAPGTQLLGSRYPVASILGAHLDGTPTLAEAGERLRAGAGETVLVWRQGFQPRQAAASPGTVAMLGSTLAGGSVLDAVDAASAPAPGPVFDLGTWLQSAIAAGWVIGVHPLPHLQPAVSP